MKFAPVGKSPRFWSPLLALLLLVGACAPGPGTKPALETAVPGKTTMQEAVVAEGTFRAHRLARCRPDDILSAKVSTKVERYLGTSSEFFRDGSGSDGMIELELGLEAGIRHPLMLLTLGQLYLLAGQGNPDLLPVEGPAADQGSYAKNKPRLLARARKLLSEALAERPDDAAVDYLLADVARAAGDLQQAAELVASGQTKCTGGRSFRILQQYQELYQHPPKYRGGPAPEFPQAALNKGIGGDVVLDLLISPAGEVRQHVVVQSPTESLSRAAWVSLRQGRFEAASMGKYAIWSWLRVTTAFNLAP